MTIEDRAWSAIEAAFDKRGSETYGEGITQLAHALQCATLAERNGAPASEIVAALLHDIGHMVHDLPETIAEQGVDAQHESIGAAWLSQYFNADVADPVRLHVAAKRYLCAAEPGYFELLSPASVLSLELQGGPMDAREQAEFRAEPGGEAAIRLRRLDDEGKDIDMRTPPLAHFRQYVDRVVKR